ncbi:hypothetical protein [Rhodococcus qingshengii]|uniref:hypothetical protein n=1 Tax=Rhodococcus qingshengii TaxID=334542 RepID=UPI00287F5271|nr:hypothetical protein [Rhodococcus qingshengii]
MSEIRSQATPARDELAEALKGGVLGLDDRNGAIYLKHEDDNRDYLTLGPSLWAWDIYAALVNLANEKPRTVNSAPELDALPVGSVIRSEYVTALKARNGAWLWDDGNYWEPLAGREVRVLFTAGDAGSGGV